ncbi:hypothetical protein N9L92_01730 [Saprospiraceae bacterium]|nr:hypothetical protein [Saprospiraceae bacterium]
MKQIYHHISISTVYQFKIICILGVLLFSNTVYTQNTFTPQVNSSSDDAEEFLLTGEMYLTSTDLELVIDRGVQQIIGLRFTEIPIPQGTNIISAYIEFETDETSTVATNLTFWGEDIDDASTFTDVDFNISSRTKTASSTDWNNIPPWNIVSEKHETPDLKDIIQEIIDRPGWTTGNDLAIIIEGLGSRIAEAFDGERANAPKLIITTEQIVEKCYAIKQLQTQGDGEFYEWNPLGGQFFVGLLGIGEAETMTLNGACNEVYTANGGEFGSIDLLTGAFNFTSVLGTLNHPTLGTHTIKDIDGMSIDNLSGYVYATERINGGNDLLIIIDPVTGEVVKGAFGPGIDYVEIPGPNQDIDDIAFNPCTNELYGVSTISGNSTTFDIIVKIDITTGQTTTVVSTLECDIEGMSFNNSCTLYVTTGNESCIKDGTVYEVDLTNGDLTEIIHFGGDVEGTVCCIDAPLPAELSCSIIQTIDDCGDGTAEAEILPAGGVGGYTFVWSHGPTTAVASDLLNGDYTVTVSDFSGRTSTCTITINSSDPSCTASEDNPVECFGESNGQATVTPSGGIGTYTYLWDNGETAATATALYAGIHNVTVTDSNECETTCSVTINQPTGTLSCGITEDEPVECFGDTNGQATVTPSGGNGDYTYLWDNGETTATAIELIAGEHTVTVTDSKGCNTVCLIEITQPDARIECTAEQTEPVLCKGEANGEAFVRIRGGSGGGSITWDNGETTRRAIALTAGNHTVTVIDRRGCQSQCVVFIEEPEFDLTCTATEVNPVECFGESNGQATVTPVGGNGDYTYLWDNGETTATAIALDAGTHTVIVTDDKDCETTCSVTISEPEATISCTIFEENPVVCFGENNGQATVTPAGGNGGYTYIWDNGETTATAAALTAGTHSVTVTDSKDCETICSILINQPAEELSCTASEDNPVVCFGEINGQATVIPAGGNGDYTFLWDNGETTATATALQAGTHTVTVMDAKACQTTCTVIVSQPTETLTCTASEDNPVECFGESNGQATVTPSGGNGGYTYIWDNGETTATATLLSEGYHTVEIEDSKGCTNICGIYISQPIQLQCSTAQITEVTCNGESDGVAELYHSGGTGSVDFLWDNGETTSRAIALNAGVHTVEITDENNCKSSCSVTINEPSAELTCTVTEDNPVVCNGETNGQATVTPTGGNGGYTYLWDNGETSATATALDAGTHSVTVRDFKNCETTCTVTITQPSATLSCTASEDNPVECFGESNGQATVTPSGGNGGYTYLWDNGEPTATATGLNAGTHTVTVTDDKNCTTTCTVIISQPSSTLSCTANEENPADCFGESNGQATVTPSGGNGGYIYLWDNGETTATATALTSGTHTVTVTDSKNCETTCTVTISQPSSTLSCSASEDNPVICFGESNGQATVIPSGGNGDYTILWDNGETTATATALDAGTHTVTVTDSKNCETTCTVIISQPSATLSCSASENNPVVCFGESNGQATVTPSGGNGGYIYLWDNGETTATALALDAGTHTVTVTDSKNCETTCTVIISQPSEALYCDVSLVKEVLCNMEFSGSATVLPSGGTPNYTYLWDNGETTETAVSLNIGLHNVTVTDANNCTHVCSIEMIEEPPQCTTIFSNGFTRTNRYYNSVQPGDLDETTETIDKKK